MIIEIFSVSCCYSAQESRGALLSNFSFISRSSSTIVGSNRGILGIKFLNFRPFFQTYEYDIWLFDFDKKSCRIHPFQETLSPMDINRASKVGVGRSINQQN